MIIEIGGGKGGLKEYLENGQKKGRELHRDQLDQRIPLFGDLNVFDLATNIHGGDGVKYDHITLSFSEHHVTDEMLQVAVDEFRDHALSAWPESERHRIAFYAEAHRPKTLSYTNSENGNEIERFTHIHIGIGRHDVATGKAISPLGYLGIKDNLKYIDAWQEYFNSRYGFSSPKDNPKITPENAIDTHARYSGVVPDSLGNFRQKKAAFEVILQKEIVSKNITEWDDFGKLLAEHGIVSKVNEGKFAECYRVIQPGADKAIRLKGIFFQRDFIERPTFEKISIISQKAKMAYLEQMQPRKEPSYVSGILTEWHTFKSRENRYLHTGTKEYKEIYQPADEKTRLQILDKLESENNGLASTSPNQNRKSTPSRSRVQRMPVRNMDGIQKRTESLLWRDSGLDVRTGPISEPVGAGLRQANGSGGGYGRSAEIGPERHGRRAARRVGPGGVGSAAVQAGLGGDIPVTQPSSVIARAQSDLLERYDRAADKERYAEIRQYLDCMQLLNSLSHSHGLNPELYQVATAKDGTPRIQCGSRALSSSDFLLKEMGLPWKEAAPILRRVYEQQIGKAVTNPRGKAAPSLLWQEFKEERHVAQKVLAERLKVFEEGKADRGADLKSAIDADKKYALAGLSGPARKGAASLEKLRAATLRAELTTTFDEERKALRESLPVQSVAWRIFLQERAQAGNEEALAALRRLDDSARVADTPTITGTIHLDDEIAMARRPRIRGASSSILRALAHAVESNGDVTYRHDGHAVLRDEGRHLAVLEPDSDEAILAGLLLAREKFGTGLTLTGSAEFQHRAVAVAAAHGISIKFVDPNLEAMRLQLLEENRIARMLPPTNALPPQAQRAAAPAAEKRSARSVVVTEQEEAATESKQSIEERAVSIDPHPDSVPSEPEYQQPAGLAEFEVERPAPVTVSQGQFSGRVVSIKDGIVTQKVHRDGRTELHDLRALSRPVAVGEVVDIKYQDGRAIVGGKEKKIER